MEGDCDYAFIAKRRSCENGSMLWKELKVPRRKSVPVRLDDGGETFHATTISEYFKPA